MIVQLIEKHFPLFQYHEETDPKTGRVRRVRVEDCRRQSRNQPREPAPAAGTARQGGRPGFSAKSARCPRRPFRCWTMSPKSAAGRTVLRATSMSAASSTAYRGGNSTSTRLGFFSRAANDWPFSPVPGPPESASMPTCRPRIKQRRVFYAFQLSWSADQQMQAFGRVHRSNQSSAPVIRLVLLDLAGQKRLVNAVSKRSGGARRADQGRAAFAFQRPIPAGRCHRRLRQSGPGTALPGNPNRPPRAKKDLA